MGKADRLEKIYLSSNERFADLFNYYLFKGEQVINADDLTERSVSELAIVKKGNRKSETYERYRDLARNCVIKQTDNAIFLILGVENQEEVHYAMPVRHMLSDALSYAGQVEKHRRRHRRKKDYTDSASFLSGMNKDDRLTPVITLTIYWGTGKWNGPRCLQDMFDSSTKDLWPYIENYRANILIPDDIEDMGVFHSDLGKVLSGIRVKNNKQALASLIEEHKSFFSDLEPDVAALLEYHTNVIIDKKGKGAGMKGGNKKLDFCKAVKDLIQDGFDQGVEQGIEQGIEKGVEQGKVLGTITTLHDEGYEDKQIVAKIRTMFGLSLKQARAYMKKALVEA